MGRVTLPARSSERNYSLRLVVGISLLLVGSLIYRLGEVTFLITGSGDLFSFGGVGIAGVGAWVALVSVYRLARRYETATKPKKP